MVAGGSFDLEAVLKVEVVLATVLTLGLLIVTVVKKRTLLSDQSRRALEANLKVFWAALFFLVVPFAMFVVTEIIEGVYRTGQLEAEPVEEVLEFTVLLLMNIGLLISFFILNRIVRAKA